ncbi:hypothetical protein S245_007931 [Arachis hypogaea]
MAKLKENDDPRIKKNNRNHGSTGFFVFVDYLFIFIFICFLCFIIYKFIGI